MVVPVVAVCFDPASAAAVVDRGGKVVLCGIDGEALAATAAALGLVPGRPASRVGVLVGDPADDRVRAAASAMARELFGQEPIVHPGGADLTAGGWGSVGGPPQVAGPTDP
jgi:hypothetical protein